jgi:hypothetical protein
VLDWPQQPSSVDRQMKEFGITISCYLGDLPLAKGCLESIRSNLDPSLPVCLITHGDVPTGALSATYGASVLREQDVDPRLRAKSYGYGLTKMIAFWHSPFERFLHIDADAVCWGNFLTGLPWHEFDLIYNEPHEVITDFIQNSQYFDPEQVFETFPLFPWQGSPFFNTGIFMGRRGIFDIHEYLDLLAFQKKCPNAFLCGDQGIFNFMAFRKIAEGSIKACAWPLQVVVPVIPADELAARFQIVGGKPVVREGDRRLIHWAGAKPFLMGERSFPAPMTHYRMEHLRRISSPRRFLGKLGLILEEIHARISARYGGNYLRAIKTKTNHLRLRAAVRLGIARRA